MNTAQNTTTDERFGGIARLFGVVGLNRLREAHVCVVGLGGVGSWAVEALARSAVGKLTLVDLDDICASNVNRQLHALDGEIGKPKVAVMAGRVLAINPRCAVHPVIKYFTASTAEEILAPQFDYVLDAIDSIAHKCVLIAACRDRALPLITTGAGGGRRTAEAVRVADLSRASHDRLLQRVRKFLRKDFAFPRGELPFGLPAVFIPESPFFPRADGTVRAQRDPGSTLRLRCDAGYGTAAFVTGTLGFAAAGYIVNRIADGKFEPQA